ncbi:MAG: protein kinase [Cyanobacteria bacterium P01_E01_bin.6]
MICCLNPHCSNPSNPDKAKICQSCGQPLIMSLRGRYTPIRLLGYGGFGRTYLAQDHDRLNANCVIKQFSPQVKGNKSLDKAIQLFNQEAIRLNELGEHAQIPTLLAYFEDEAYLYLVQQYIEGQNLFQELNQNGIFSEAKIREILLSLLPVLQFIHDRQVIHRDITPMNILRRQRDDRLMLIDFGVAKQLSSDFSEQAGTRIGTEGYSPIEQFRGGRAYPASDIYSLGATSIHLLTRMKPENLYDPLSGEWVWQQRMADKGNVVSDQLAHVLNRMLKDLVNERYQSANDVLKDLQDGSGHVAAAYSSETLGTTHGRDPAPSPGHSSVRSTFSSMPQSRQRSSNTNSSGQTSEIRSQRRSSGSPRGNPHDSSSRPPASRQPVSRQPTSRPSNSSPSVSRPSTSGASGRNSSGYRSKYCRCVYTITGHSSWVTDVAISPVTNTFATSSLDDTVKLWNLQTGELMMSLTGHERGVNAVTFSPDGTLLLSCSDDRRIKIWDAFSGKLVRTLSGHIRDVTALAVSPDGQFLMTGGEDRSIRVWQLATGKLLKTPFGVMSMVKALAATPDGRLFVSGGLDKIVRLWSMRTAERVTELSGHHGAVHTLAISPNSQVLASAGKDRTIRLWHLPDGAPLHTFQGHSRDVNSIAIMPDGRLLLSASSDKTIRIWDIPTGNLVDTLIDHLDSVNAIAVHHDRKTFISCSSDKTIKVWRLRTR